MYTIRTRVVTVASAGICIASLWNGHATARIYVAEYFILSNVGLGSEMGVSFVDISTRGTPGSTITPTIANHSLLSIAPISGVVVDRATFTVAPGTPQDINMGGWFRTNVGCGLLRRVDRWVVPGKGIAFWQQTATIGNWDIGFSWYEDTPPLILSDFNFPTISSPKV